MLCALHLFNTRLGPDAKLFTLQIHNRIIKSELKWFVNAGAESSLGVSVGGVDKHDTTLFSVCWSTRNGAGFGSAGNGLTCESNGTVQPPKTILEILEVPRGKRDMLFSRRKAGQEYVTITTNQSIDKKCPLCCVGCVARLAASGS